MLEPSSNQARHIRIFQAYLYPVKGSRGSLGTSERVKVFCWAESPGRYRTHSTRLSRLQLLPTSECNPSEQISWHFLQDSLRFVSNGCDRSQLSCFLDHSDTGLQNQILVYETWPPPARGRRAIRMLVSCQHADDCEALYAYQS